MFKHFFTAPFMDIISLLFKETYDEVLDKKYI